MDLPPGSREWPVEGLAGLDRLRLEVGSLDQLEAGLAALGTLLLLDQVTLMLQLLLPQVRGRDVHSEIKISMDCFSLFLVQGGLPEHLNANDYGGRINVNSTLNKIKNSFSKLIFSLCTKFR